jgi:hypothetical protein
VFFVERRLAARRQISRDQRESDECFLRAARKEAADARDELWKALAKRESDMERAFERGHNAAIGNHCRTPYHLLKCRCEDASNQAKEGT